MLGLDQGAVQSSQPYIISENGSNSVSEYGFANPPVPGSELPAAAVVLLEAGFAVGSVRGHGDRDAVRPHGAALCLGVCD